MNEMQYKCRLALIEAAPCRA